MADHQATTAETIPGWLLAGLRAIEPGGVWCAYAPKEVGRCAARLVEMGLVTIRVQHGDWFVRRTARGDAIANG